MRSLCLLLLLTGATVHGQRVADVTHFVCADSSAQLKVSPLHGDSLCSSFLICITGEVPLHLHRAHTEHVAVIAGEGWMTLGDSTFVVRGGQVLVIPRGTPHAVRRLGDVPLQVVSVQAPAFDGTDRVMLAVPKR